MIDPATGEIGFDDGLRITAHTLIAPLLELFPTGEVSTRPIPVSGWHQHVLGQHSSRFGRFIVKAVTGREGRVEGVFLSHCHDFYEAATPSDAERRAFHEGVIATDLRGQQEFSWGHAFCRLEREANRDWLVVIYSPFSSVPLHKREIYQVLIAHELPPEA